VYDKLCCFYSCRIARHLLPQALLDLDDRFGAFFPRSFYRYNMLSGTALLPSEHEAIQSLLERCDVVIVDPPFSAPIEALAVTLSHIRRRNSNVKLLLLFPYFQEKAVLQAMPDLHMLGYRVQYSHKNYSNESTPVRIFTNIPLQRIPSPQEAGYTLCLHCNDWMFHTNTHCKLCNKCTSIGGVARLHCRKCNTCVKIGSQHCLSCASCHPKNTPCPPKSRCTVCASVHHRRQACPRFKLIVQTALAPWAVPLDPPQKKRKVARRAGKPRAVARGVGKRQCSFIFAHVCSSFALLKCRLRVREHVPGSLRGSASRCVRTRMGGACAFDGV